MALSMPTNKFKKQAEKDFGADRQKAEVARGSALATKVQDECSFLFEQKEVMSRRGKRQK